MEETPRSTGQLPQEAGQPAPSGWYLARRGQTYGPYPRETLEAGVELGQVLASDQVWSPDLGAWHPASAVLTALSSAALPARAPDAATASSDQVASNAEAWQAPLSDAEAWKAPVQAQPAAAATRSTAQKTDATTTRKPKKHAPATKKTHQLDAPFNSMSHEMGPVAWALGILLLAAACGALTAVVAFGMGGPGAAAPSGEGRDFLRDVYTLLHFFALIEAATLVLAVVLITRWLSHAHENLAALAGDDPVGRPVTAPGSLPGFLVGPSLWLAEIWMRSSPNSRETVGTNFPKPVTSWIRWTLVGLVAAGIGIVAALLSEARSGSRGGLLLYLVSLVFVVLAAIATRSFEKAVAGRQDKRYRELIQSDA